MESTMNRMNINSEDPIGVALFAVGRAGAIHLKNLIANHRVRVLYIVEPDKAKVISLLQKYRKKDIKVLDTSESNIVYEDPRVAAVFVCTPTNQHENIVREALRHDKSVFCEKPISMDLDSAKACYETAKKANKTLFCSFNRRFDPSLAKLREQTVAGKIGQPHVIKTCSRDSPVPSIEYLSISGGVFHDCVVHDFDMVCWILQDTPVSVFAMAHAHRNSIAEINDVDTAVIIMKFASGTLAQIDISRLSCYGYDQRVEVYGSDGMLVSENQRKTEMTSYLKTEMSKENIHYSFPERYADGYKAALEHFLNVIEGQEELSITGIQTVNVSVIAEACEQSYKRGCPVGLTKDNDGMLHLQQVNNQQTTVHPTKDIRNIIIQETNLTACVVNAEKTD